MPNKMHHVTERICWSKLLNDAKIGYFQVNQEENVPERENRGMSYKNKSWQSNGYLFWTELQNASD